MAKVASSLRWQPVDERSYATRAMVTRTKILGGNSGHGDEDLDHVQLLSNPRGMAAFLAVHMFSVLYLTIFPRFASDLLK